jgi:hypothetical protein
MLRRRRLILLVLTLSTTAAVTTAPTANAQSPTSCTATFDVLHDDHIGSVPVSAGKYQLRTGGLSCAQAASLFAEFLSDYDGVLQRPWRYNGDNTFSRSTTGDAFTFVPLPDGSAAISGPGWGSHGDLACPGTFRVLHNDRVGQLSIPRGAYQVTLLGSNRSCNDAKALFARFLNRPDGQLGNGWSVLPQGAEFVRGSTRDGFRIKPVHGAA